MDKVAENLYEYIDCSNSDVLFGILLIINKILKFKTSTLHHNMKCYELLHILMFDMQNDFLSYGNKSHNKLNMMDLLSNQWPKNTNQILINHFKKI